MPTSRMSGPPPPRGKRASKTNLIRIGLTTPRPEVKTISPTASSTWRRWGRERPNTRRARGRLVTRPLGLSAGGGRGWRVPSGAWSGGVRKVGAHHLTLATRPPARARGRRLSRGLLLGTVPLGSLPPPARLPVEGGEEGAAPEPDGEGGPEEDHGVDALAPLPGPVDVLEIEPESEFVEG